MSQLVNVFLPNCVDLAVRCNISRLFTDIVSVIRNQVELKVTYLCGNSSNKDPEEGLFEHK